MCNKILDSPQNDFGKSVKLSWIFGCAEKYFESNYIFLRKNHKLRLIFGLCPKAFGIFWWKSSIKVAEIVLSMSGGTFWENKMFFSETIVLRFFTEIRQKFLGRFVENAFCVSNGTFWGFFQKIVTLNLLFCLGGTKSDYWQISCGRVVETAFDFCRGEFGWTIPSLEKDILLCSLSDFERKFFGFGRKIIERVQSYTISFLYLEQVSLTEFF